MSNNMITISLPVARAVVATPWMAMKERGAGASARQRFATISARPRQQRCRTFSLSDASVTQSLLEGVQAAVEANRNSAQVLEPLQEVAAALEQALEDIAANEAREAVKAAEQSQQWRKERGQRPLSLSVEMNMRSELRATAEIYGLDFKDPQIRAAMIAAFRTGARELHDRTEVLLFRELEPFTDEDQKRHVENNQRLFAKAEAAVERAKELNAPKEAQL
jgi:DNA-binding FrmR family transcriptional regulator